MNPRSMSALLFTSLLILAACSGNDGLNENTPDIPTATVNDVEVTLPEEETQEEISDAELLEEDCLIGRWYLDHDSLARYIEKSMNISSEIRFVVTAVEGELDLIFTGDRMLMTNDIAPLLIEVEIVAGDTLLGTTIVVIDAIGGADYFAFSKDEVGTEFHVLAQVAGSADYILDGSGNFEMSLDETMTGESEVHLTPAMFSGMAESGDVIYELVPEIAQSGSASYAYFLCSGNELQIWAWDWVNRSLTFYLDD